MSNILQERKRYFKFVLIFLSAIILLLIPHLIGISGKQAAVAADSNQFSVKVSTRGHFDLKTGELMSGYNETNYTASNIPGLPNGICSNEVAIIVHGWSLNENYANERFVRANMSLDHNNYNNNNNNNSVIGFSWDANTTLNPSGWIIAKSIAKDNGPKLAQFISDYKNKCQATEIRLIAHSLGSRIVLNALDALHNNQKWNNENFTVTSVHLMGAAVDNEEVSKDLSYIEKNQPILNNITQLMNSISEWYDVYGIKSAYGKIIEKEVNKFYNLFDPKDKALIREYAKSEYDNALGLTGKQEGIIIPSNYNQTDVQDQILPLADADGDGKCDFALIKNERLEKGYNHAGYFGFTNMTNNKKMFINDGAMDVVVNSWKNGNVEPKNENLTFPSSLSICLDRQ